jgi:hypothetical protein
MIFPEEIYLLWEEWQPLANPLSLNKKPIAADPAVDALVSNRLWQSLSKILGLSGFK